MTPEQEQSILSAIDRELAADRRDPLIRLVREIFDSYGQSATGRDHATVHAVVAALKPPSQHTWQGLPPEEFKYIASKYLLNREAGLEYFQEELETKLRELNT